MTPSPAPCTRATTLLVTADLGDEACGVGSSEAVSVAQMGTSIRVLDPVLGSWREFGRRAGAGLDGVAGAVLVYPTISQVGRLRLVPRALALRRRLGRRWLRVHLHEFDHLDRRQRLAVATVLGLVADRVVVSSADEADALRSRYGGWAARRAEIVVVPPANPSVPRATDHGLDGAVVRGTVGVHGQYRPDKGIDWLIATLGRLDRRFGRLEIAGRGWAAAPWPRSLLDRFEIVDLGQTAGADLPVVMAGWELALAPFAGPPTDGRLSLRTPLAYGVPTLTRGPRPASLRLDAPHLLFDDETDLGALPVCGPEGRRAGAARVAELEAEVRGEVAAALFA